jgi:hypothetical protein
MKSINWLSCKANPQRGLSHRDDARAFALKFPLGTIFTNSDFDEWAYECEYYPRVPAPRKGNEDSKKAWCYHVYQRGRLRKRLNNAGCHPDMEQLAFKIVKREQRHDQWETITPLAVVQDPQAFDNLVRAVEGEREWFRFAVESIRWDQLQPHDQMQVQFACHNLDFLAKELAFKTNSYRELCEQYRATVNEAIQRGADPAKRIKKLLQVKMLPFGED